MFYKGLCLIILFASWLCVTSEHEIGPQKSSSFKQRLVCGWHPLLFCRTGIIEIWGATYIHVNSSDCSLRNDQTFPKVQCSNSEARRIISASCNGVIQCDILPFLNCEENYNALDILYTCQTAKIVISHGKDNIQHLQCGREKGVLSVFSAHCVGRDNHTSDDNRLANRQLSNTQRTLNGTIGMISHMCDGKTECEFNMNTLRDPCPGINKYLNTSYTCVPAKSVVVCEHQTMSINCGQDVIKIVSSNYGRRDQTTCSAGRPKNQVVKTDCFLPKTLTDIAYRCDQRTKCSVSASNSVFSDPCVGTFKYLEVSFTCLPAERSITCENSVSTISCDEVIRILYANYGRQNNDICNVGRPASQASNVNCNSPSAMASVFEMCDGKKTCDLDSNNVIFGDPCPGTYKYLDVSYTCGSVYLSQQLSSLPDEKYLREKMKTEVSAASGFITSLLRTTGLLSENQLDQFSLALEEALGDHYQHHWFPQAPCKGSGYRCIRINHKMDPVIGRAACTVGLTVEQLFSLLPSELTLWVDPYEVSYRIGEDGSICVLYESAPPITTHSNSTDLVSCKNGLRIGRTSPSESFNIMTVSS